MSRRSKGEGTILQLPDGRWRARITIDGKTVTRDRTSRQTAEQALRDLREHALLGTVPSSWTLRQWIVHYLDTIADHAPTTRAGYDTTLRAHITPNIGGIRLEKLKPEHLEGLYKSMRDGTYKTHKLKSGKYATPNKLAGATIHITHALLHRALKVAAQRGHVTRNVAEFVQPPRASAPKTTTLSVESSRRILQQAITGGEGARWAIALMLGIRPGEALGLAWDCIDGDRIEIRQQLQQVTGRGLELRRLTKTDKSRRWIPLPDVIVQLLEQQRQAQLQWMIEEGDKWETWTPPDSENPLLMIFTDHRGTPITPRQDGKLWARLLERAGVPHTRRYTARHTAASLLISEGVDIPVVAERLGHKDAAFTMRTYVHPVDEKQRAANDAISRLLG